MKIVRSLLFASLVLLPLSPALHAQAGGCDGSSTLKDTYSPADTKRAEQFLLDLKAAVHANDTAKVASLIQYPVRINLPNGVHRQIRTPQQFRAQYSFLFNADTRKAIADQVPQCMFARDQGVMIGNGQIWFQDDGHGVFRIWSFNHM